jgi:hypothetical protein
VTDFIEINKLKMITKKKGLENDLAILFGKSVSNIISGVGDEVTIKEVVIKGFLSSNIVDPNGVRIFNSI